jgi:hypothetical protein
MSQWLRRLADAAAWLLLVAALAERAAALGMEAFGPADEHIGRSPEWPKGVEDVLRHPSRVYWCDVNGNEAAYYDGGVEAVNELLELYSRVDIAERRVVIRPGRPSARSFHDKLTPYVVKFDVPGGIYLHHLQEYAQTGLYSPTPRLIVHLDAALAEHLDELAIPDNVSLYELEYRVEDALAHADDEDHGVRYRAIVALGDAADSSAAAIKALRRAARDENESIRNAGAAALEQSATAMQPDEAALRRRLADFVRGHAQHASVPNAEELLAALRNVDAQYAKGFTARGTLVEPTPTGPGRLIAWTITMGDGRLVIEQRDVEDADHPPAPGRSEYTIYAGPERMGSIHGYRLWVDGKLIDAKPHATFEPVGSTYDLLIGRTLWPLGRGFTFTRRIDEIKSVAVNADGLLTVVATGGGGSSMSRWELQVDPAADYLVRSAKAFRRDETEPSYVVDTAGVFAGGGHSVVHTARWTEGIAGQPTSIAVTSVSATADAELIRRTENRLDELSAAAR